jgi:hypothetical protein
MVKYKLTDNPEPTTFSKDEIDKYFGGVRTRFGFMRFVLIEFFSSAVQLPRFELSSSR